MADALVPSVYGRACPAFRNSKGAHEGRPDGLAGHRPPPQVLRDVHEPVAIGWGLFGGFEVERDGELLLDLLAVAGAGQHSFRSVELRSLKVPRRKCRKV
jgi:hypothetical protein